MDKIEIFFVNNCVFNKNYSRCFILLQNRLYGQITNSLSATTLETVFIRSVLPWTRLRIIDFYIVVLLILCLMSSAFICDTLCIVFFTQILFNCIDVNIYWLFLELNVAFYYLCLGFVKTLVNDSISQRIKCIFTTKHQKFVNVT